jgi:hypothetical protein
MLSQLLLIFTSNKKHQELASTIQNLFKNMLKVEKKYLQVKQKEV